MGPQLAPGTHRKPTCLGQEHEPSQWKSEDASDLETVWGAQTVHSRDSSVKIPALVWTMSRVSSAGTIAQADTGLSRCGR